MTMLTAVSQARARKGMAVDHVVGQAQLQSNLAHLVLEQFAQGLRAPARPIRTRWPAPGGRHWRPPTQDFRTTGRALWEGAY